MKNLISILFLISTQVLKPQPSFEWAKNMGGAESDLAYSIATDASGNVYTTGSFRGLADFDPGPGTFNLISGGQNDIFISKLDANGNFIWAKSIGNNGNDYALQIVADAIGNVILVGGYNTNTTVDFDPGPGIFNLTPIGSYDMFILKLDASGNFVWAKSVDAQIEPYGNSMALDASNNVFITGAYYATVDFDPGAGTFSLSSTGGSDIFILKLDAAGNFVWAKTMGGGTEFQWGNAIEVDINGNIYTMGHFKGTPDFDPGIGTFTLSTAGLFDIFILKLSSAGNFIWAKSLGGAYDDYGKSITLDELGNVYTTGQLTPFGAPTDFDPGPGTFNLTSVGAYDIFISKLDTGGNFVWAKSMGGPLEDVGMSIYSDAFNNIYTTGYYNGTVDFDAGAGTFSITSAGDDDIFICKMESDGDFIWAKSMGGLYGEYGISITLDAANNIYTTGWFSGDCEFNPGPGSYVLAPYGTDVFVHKMSQSPDAIYENPNQKPLFSFYPNPISNKINIEFINSTPQFADIKILNQLGQIVYERKKWALIEKEILLNNLANGLYFLKISTGLGEQCEKIVVQR